ncbi:MAG: carboxypeptidase-like regulatory domain-containing protein [Actinomycetota bacterium]
MLLDGAAVPGATVVLMPTGGGLAATGLSGADGRFTVATVTAGKSWPGAVQGTYVVTATKIEAAAGTVIDPSDPKYDPLASVNPGSGPKYVIPKDYGEQATSGLTATITQGKNDLKFELDSKFKAAK